MTLFFASPHDYWLWFLAWQMQFKVTAVLLMAGVPAWILFPLVVQPILHSEVQLDGALSTFNQLQGRLIAWIATMVLAFLPLLPIHTKIHPQESAASSLVDNPLRSLDLPQPSGSNQPVQTPLLAGGLWLLGYQVNALVVRSLHPSFASLTMAAVLNSPKWQQEDELLGEYDQFVTDCYQPAQAKAKRLGVSEDQYDWPGARWLSETPGFYAACQNDRIDSCQEGAIYASASLPPQVLGTDGRLRGGTSGEDGSWSADAQSGKALISCNSWWNGEESSPWQGRFSGGSGNGAQGLRGRLLEGLEKNLGEEGVLLSSLLDGSLDEDALLKHFLRLSSEHFLGNSLLPNLFEAASTAGSFVSGSWRWLRSHWSERALMRQMIHFSHTLTQLSGALSLLLASVIFALWPLLILIRPNKIQVGLMAWGWALLLGLLWPSLTHLGVGLHNSVWEYSLMQRSSVEGMLYVFDDSARVALFVLTGALPWLLPPIVLLMFWRKI